MHRAGGKGIKKMAAPPYSETLGSAIGKSIVASFVSFSHITCKSPNENNVIIKKTAEFSKPDSILYLKNNVKKYVEIVKEQKENIKVLMMPVNMDESLGFLTRMEPEDSGWRTDV